jgi:L,D-peptidoglycan transpeptidase YkuD (ErfK/YbiS/YcfS/YnhG family)
MSSAVARIHAGHRVFPCLVGRNGMTNLKFEGDGKSPVGSFAMTGLLFRADRHRRIASTMATRAITPIEAWCDDKTHRSYNKSMPQGLPGSDERLWRKDSAYDFLVVLDYNTRPRIIGKGSAIFFHLIRPGASGTAGCVAVTLADMKKLLAICGRHTRMVIGPT